MERGLAVLSGFFFSKYGLYFSEVLFEEEYHFAETATIIHVIFIKQVSIWWVLGSYFFLN